MQLGVSNTATTSLLVHAIFAALLACLWQFCPGWSSFYPVCGTSASLDHAATHGVLVCMAVMIRRAFMSKQHTEPGDESASLSKKQSLHSRRVTTATCHERRIYPDLTVDNSLGMEASGKAG